MRRGTASERPRERLDAGRERGRRDEAAHDGRDRDPRTVGFRAGLERRLGVDMRGVGGVGVLEAGRAVRGRHVVEIVVIVMTERVLASRMDVGMVAIGVMMGVEAGPRERARRRKQREDREGSRPEAARAQHRRAARSMEASAPSCGSGVYDELRAVADNRMPLRANRQRRGGDSNPRSHEGSHDFESADDRDTGVH